jgi:hypothetical protein
MRACWSRNGLRALLVGMIGGALPLALLSAQPPAPPPPRVAFRLGDRHGHATPERTGAARTGGGNVEVTQPSDDTLNLIMTGVVVAGPHPCKESSALMDFDLNQGLEIVFADPALKKARLTIAGRLTGLLRGDKYGGSASVGRGEIAVTSSHGAVVALSVEGHAVSGGENLAINDRKGSVSVSVLPGEYQVVQTLHIEAAHARSICGKAASAEFAPDPALDPTWISVTEPFHGANKKDFGFRVVLRVEPDEDVPAKGSGTKEELAPQPRVVPSK